MKDAVRRTVVLIVQGIAGVDAWLGCGGPRGDPIKTSPTRDIQWKGQDSGYENVMRNDSCCGAGREGCRR
jgi:hypothetical protein